MDDAPEVVAMAAQLRARYPRFRLVAKESSRFMRWLYALTGMRLWNPRFLESFTTTIGYTVYMPAAARRDPAAGPQILRHEAIHLEQFRRHPVWFPLSYLFVLPAGVTMRAHWELEAYAETMRCEFERTGTVSDATVDALVETFAGPRYLFMDVRRGRVRRRLEALRQRVLGDAVR